MLEWQTPKWQRENGFAAPGDIVVFLNRNGWSSDPEYARKAGLVEGQEYLVTCTSVGNSSSTYEFEGIKGSFNTVMFRVKNV